MSGHQSNSSEKVQARCDAAEANLRALFAHWNEFGPECGFGELIESMQGDDAHSRHIPAVDGPEWSYTPRTTPSREGYYLTQRMWSGEPQGPLMELWWNGFHWYTCSVGGFSFADTRRWKLVPSAQGYSLPADLESARDGLMSLGVPRTAIQRATT